ncbi:ATP-binding protein [Mycetocola miduiensis]|uniref:ATP-binding protein n=1 Tax=Mycetocola miduiensis TaxID=995034 RepID=UPI0011606C82
MPNAEVLVLHGSPGSGKSTLARALFEQLRVADQSVAVIDPAQQRPWVADRNRRLSHVSGASAASLEVTFWSP